MGVVRLNFDAATRRLKDKSPDLPDRSPLLRNPGCGQRAEYQRSRDQLNVLVQNSLLERQNGSLDCNSGRQINLINTGFDRVSPHAASDRHLNLPVPNRHFGKQGVANKVGKFACVEPVTYIGCHVILPEPQSFGVGNVFVIAPLIEVMPYYFQGVPRFTR